MHRHSVVRSFTASLLLVAASVSGASGQSFPAPQPAARLLYDEALAAVDVPGFAGVWMDGGALVVSMTAPTSARARSARTQLARLFGRLDLAGKRVVAQRARYSFRQLRAWYDAAAADVAGVAGLRGSDVDERANVLRYGVADLTSAAPVVRAVLARYGVPADAVVVDRAAANVPTSLEDAARPLVGGVRIEHTGALTCSLGFPAVRGGVKGFVTAAHCSRVQGVVEGTAYSQPSIGALPPVAVEVADPPFFAGGACPSTTRTPVCRYSDASFNALLDETHYAQGRIARPPAGSIAWNGVDLFRITAETTPILGETVSKVGQTTGLTSGIVTTTCADPIPSIGLTRDQMPWRLLCQTDADYATFAGDSGGPVFVVTSGNDVALAGVHWNGTAMFSPIANVERSDELGPLATCDPSVTCP